MFGWLTPFHHADATKVLATGDFNWSGCVVLGVAAMVLLAAAALMFERKDVVG